MDKTIAYNVTAVPVNCTGEFTEHGTYRILTITGPQATVTFNCQRGSGPILSETVVVARGSTYMKTQWSINGSTLWHDTFATGDLYMRQSADGGVTWGAASRVVGETGAVGPFTDFRYQKNTSSSVPPSYTAGADNPGAGWLDAPLNTAAGEFNWMIQADWQGSTRLTSWSIPIRITGDTGSSGNYPGASNLFEAHSFDAIPDITYPDGEAGTIKRLGVTADQAWTGTTDSSSGAHTSGIVAGVLTRTSSTASGFLRSQWSGFSLSSPLIMVRFRATLYKQAQIYATVNGVMDTLLYTGPSDGSYVTRFIRVTGTVTLVHVNLAITAIGQSVDLAQLYIGDGSYSWQIADDSGNGHPLTSVGGLSRVVGRFRWALQTDGVTGYAHGVLSGFTDKITVAFWENFSTYTAVDKYLLESSTNSQDNTGAFRITLAASAPGRLLLRVRTSTSYLGGYYLLPSSGWHHIAIVYDKTIAGDSALLLYVGGVSVAITYDFPYSGAGTLPSLYNGPLYVHSRAGTSLFADGAIDELRIDSRVLSSVEIQAMATMPAPTPPVHVPVYLGEATTDPTATGIGDFYLNTTSLTVGLGDTKIRKYNGTSWTDVTTPTSDQISAAQTDILNHARFLNGTFTNVGALSTFSRIFAQSITMAVGGSLQASDGSWSIAGDGTITATKGLIAGWTLSTTALTGDNISLSKAGDISVGSANNIVRLSSTDATYSMWAGHATAGSAPFRVTKAGAIISTSGTIGGWTLSATSLVSGSGAATVGIDSGGTNPAFYAGSATPGSAPFRVSNVGVLTAAGATLTTATVTGTITATAGAIAAFTIAAATISATNLVLTSGAANAANITVGTGATAGGLNSPAAGGDVAFWAGSTFANRATAAFRVTAAGALTATGVTISGAVTATSGAIGGWTLGATSLVAGSGATTVGLDSGGTNPAIYAGSATPGSAPFRVTNAGVLTATSGTIASWVLSATSLDSGAAGSARIKLDKTSNRVSVMNSSDTEVTSMGYLGGLLKNGSPWSATKTYTIGEYVNVGGVTYKATATSLNQTPPNATYWAVSTDTWTASDYGFWAKAGQQLKIDGDVQYANGDWIVARDSSYLIKQGSTVVTRLGMMAGNNGLWINETLTGSSFRLRLTTADFFIGNDTQNLTYSGGNLSVTGNINSASGTIGGWTLGATSLLSGSGATTVGIDSGGTNPAFYAGSATPGSAPFRVTNAGALTATSGAIATFTLATTTISATNLVLTSGAANTANITVGTGSTAGGLNSPATGSDIAFWAGSTFANRATAAFRVTAAGSVTATSGTIGGWTLSATSLTSGSGSTTVGIDSGGTNPAFYAGSATPGSAPFRVTNAGVLTATSGAIAAFTLAATSISATNLVITSGAANTANITVGTGATAAGLNSPAAGSDIAFWAGSTFANRATASFSVTAAGSITSTSGSIGGWTIGTTTLVSGSGVTTVGLDASGSDTAIYAGASTPASAPFRVTRGGLLSIVAGSYGGISVATSLTGVNGIQVSCTGDSYGINVGVTAGVGIYVSSSGSSYYGIYCTSNTATPAVYVRNQATGTGITIRNENVGAGLYIDCTSTGVGLKVGGHGVVLPVRSSTGATNEEGLMYFKSLSGVYTLQVYMNGAWRSVALT